VIAAGAALSSSADAAAVAGARHVAPRIVARGESGAVLLRRRALWLAPGRVGVPVAVYDRLGIVVEPKRRPRMVILGVPHSDMSYHFVPGRRRLSGQSANLRFTQPLLPYPVARARQGEVYVAAAAVQREMGDLVQARWRPRTRTLVLQRTKKLGSLPSVQRKSPGQRPGLNARS
jgi:hypothetical protein